jgi:hypothetical protein
MLAKVEQTLKKAGGKPRDSLADEMRKEIQAIKEEAGKNK